MADRWFYVLDGRRFGPVAATEIVERVVRFQIPAGTLVWRKGLEGWQPAELVPELAAEIPPPLPPEIATAAAVPEPEPAAAASAPPMEPPPLSPPPLPADTEGPPPVRLEELLRDSLAKEPIVPPPAPEGEGESAAEESDDAAPARRKKSLWLDLAVSVFIALALVLFLALGLWRLLGDPETTPGGDHPAAPLAAIFRLG